MSFIVSLFYSIISPEYWLKLLTKTNTVLFGIKLKIIVLLQIPLESAVNQIIILVRASGSGNTTNSTVYIIKSAA